MALVAVSLREVQETNLERFRKCPDKPLKGKWHSVQALSPTQGYGVSTGRINPKQDNCFGRTVIPPYCPPTPAPSFLHTPSCRPISRSFSTWPMKNTVCVAKRARMLIRINSVRNSPRARIPCAG